MFMGFVVSLIWSQVYRYRRISSPEQRRPTKWVVFGLTLGVGGTFPLQVPVDFSWLTGDTPLTLLFLKWLFVILYARPAIHQRSRVPLAPLRYRRHH